MIKLEMELSDIDYEVLVKEYPTTKTKALTRKCNG